jgi:uncharacterized membrane protein
MENILVAVFNSEAQAGEAWHVLESLAEANTIGLNAGAIVTKSAGGAITVSGAQRPMPEGALGATAVGTLIGMLGGPVGLAIGAATGLALGATADVFDLKLERDFLAEVERALEPDTSAVVAQIYEEEIGKVNERMAAFGAVVFLRRALADVANDDDTTQVAAIRRHLRGADHV